MARTNTSSYTRSRSTRGAQPDCPPGMIDSKAWRRRGQQCPGVFEIVKLNTATRVGGRLDLDRAGRRLWRTFLQLMTLAQHVTSRALVRPSRDQPATDDLKL